MQRKLQRITVGIAAYNEEQNIKNFLGSLLSQKENGFVFQKIVVISDGSTDRTFEQAKSIADPRMRVIKNPVRLGKSTYLNYFFREFSSDIILIFDADVVLDSSQTVSNLIRPLLHDSRVGLVGGNAQQLPGRTFIENAINLTCGVYDVLRLAHRGGHNAFGANGCILALSREFARTVLVPADMIANDQFLYFAWLRQGFKFVHQRDAIAWYRSPSTLRDQVRQNKRFIASHYRMEKVFGKELVQKEYAVPKSLLWKLQLKAFLRKPIHALAIFVINLYCRALARLEERRMGAKWLMAPTTKERIVYDLR